MGVPVLYSFDNIPIQGLENGVLEGSLNYDAVWVEGGLTLGFRSSSVDVDLGVDYQNNIPIFGPIDTPFDEIGSYVADGVIALNNFGSWLGGAIYDMQETISGTDYSASTWSSSADSAASGGFVLYPSRVNTNMTQEVYKK